MTQTEIEKELERFIASGKATKKDNSGRYQITYIDPLKIAKHFVEWQKEQMMKDAVIIEDELAMCYNNGEPTGLSPYKEWWETPEVQNKFKDGDKVKVIIIKE